MLVGSISEGCCLHSNGMGYATSFTDREVHDLEQGQSSSLLPIETCRDTRQQPALGLCYLSSRAT